MNVLTELPIHTYFEQLLSQKCKNGNFVESLNRLMSINDKDPDRVGKYILLKNETMNGDRHYLLDMDTNHVCMSTEGTTGLLEQINKQENFVAVNFAVPVRKHDNKTYVQIDLCNPEIINHLEKLWQTEHTTAAVTQ